MVTNSWAGFAEQLNDRTGKQRWRTPYDSNPRSNTNCTFFIHFPAYFLHFY
jgi:hypothetical protein